MDSAKGDADGFSAIRNLFNEWYPRDTSKKVRVVFRQKGTSGKHLGKPPYGYRTDPADKEYWVIGKEAAPVVKRIFDLTIDGKGPEQIARILEQDKVLTAKALYAKQSENHPDPKNGRRCRNALTIGLDSRLWEFWNGWSTQAAPVTSRPIPNPTS